MNVVKCTHMKVSHLGRGKELDMRDTLMIVHQRSGSSRHGPRHHRGEWSCHSPLETWLPATSERTGSMGVQRIAPDTHHVSIDLISKDGHTLS